jgi:hypothetical protein
VPHISEVQRAAALVRWERSDVVDERVDALAASIRRTIDKLPPLTPAQRDLLAAVLRGGDQK